MTDRERHAVAQVATDASCIGARSILVAARGSAICLVAAARAPYGRHSWPRLPRPIGVYRGHEGDDNGQSIRAIGSALHLAYQQAAGAPDVALSSPTSAAMSAAINSSFTSLASHCIWCTRRTRLVPRIRSLALRTSPNRPRIRTETTDADATIFVVLSVLTAAAVGRAVGSAAA